MGGLILLCLAFLAVVTGIFLVYRRLVRGSAEQVILMDGAVCAVISDQEVIIRPRTGYTLLVMVILIPCLAGTVMILVDPLISGSNPMEFDDVETLIGLIVFLAVAIFFAIRTLLRKRLLFDGSLGELQIKGREKQTIPFQRITEIGTSSKLVELEVEAHVEMVTLHLDDGSSIKVGSLSGAPEDTKARTDQIVTLLSSMIGAPAEPRTDENTAT